MTMDTGMIKFTIPVPPITKKNHSQIVHCRGKHILVPSSAYTVFEEKSIYLIPAKYKKLHIDYPVNVKAIYYVARNARVDKTNLESALMDTLVKAGVLADDSAMKPAIVVSTDGSRVYYDKMNPRIEIEIKAVNEDGD